MTSDLESSQGDDDLDKAYIPRKLFRGLLIILVMKLRL